MVGLSLLYSVYSDCNYIVQQEFLFILIGWFPAPYPEGYCNNLNGTSFWFECDDSESGTVYFWDNGDCSGNALNSSQVSGSYVMCSGDNSGCDIYNMIFEAYNGDCDVDPALTTDTLIDSSDSACFMLTFFGYNL